MNNSQEFDPTNQNDPNYDSTLHQQHEEEVVAQTPPAEVTPAPKAPTTAERHALLTPEEREVLRKMQVSAGVQDAPIQDLSLSDEQLLIKKKLSLEEKVLINIPLEGEKMGAYRSVTINGYRFEVKKGKMVRVPATVAKLLMQAYDIEQETLNDNELNLNNAGETKKSALGMV